MLTSKEDKAHFRIVLLFLYMVTRTTFEAECPFEGYTILPHLKETKEKREGKYGAIKYGAIKERERKCPDC